MYGVYNVMFLSSCVFSLSVCMTWLIIIIIIIIIRIIILFAKVKTTVQAE